jgi:RNA polymerase sigma-70 factor (ECF subfamily)
MVERTQTSTATDTELIGSTHQGDLAAFGVLTQRYWSLAVAVALSRLDNPADAEDVAQESFIKAFHKLTSLRDASRFAGWLSRIVVQQCVDAHRQQQRARQALGRSIPAEDVLEACAAYSSNPGLSSQQIRFIRQTIAKLPEKYKRPIIMRFVTGLSAVEIARQLGKRPGTVRVWLHRAYELLRQDLSPLLEEVSL